MKPSTLEKVRAALELARHESELDGSARLGDAVDAALAALDADASRQADGERLRAECERHHVSAALALADRHAAYERGRAAGFAEAREAAARIVVSGWVKVGERIDSVLRARANAIRALTPPASPSAVVVLTREEAERVRDALESWGHFPEGTRIGPEKFDPGVAKTLGRAKSLTDAALALLRQRLVGSRQERTP